MEMHLNVLNEQDSKRGRIDGGYIKIFPLLLSINNITLLHTYTLHQNIFMVIFLTVFFSPCPLQFQS